MGKKQNVDDESTTKVLITFDNDILEAIDDFSKNTLHKKRGRSLAVNFILREVMLKSNLVRFQILKIHPKPNEEGKP